MARIESTRGFSLIELLVVMAVIGIVTGMAAPMLDGSIQGNRLRNDAKEINKMVGLAKMRATARFSRARVAVSPGVRQYRLEVWNRTTGSWDVEGVTRTLSRNVNFGFGALNAAPPSTQVAIAMSSACTTSTSLTALDAGTSCITFNSRGIPIDPNGDQIGGNAIYINDGVGVRGVTVTRTPLIREWWSAAHSPGWIRQ
jgi:prepilin-type N-terminal cleavage/methylation domain-containing protein